MVEISQGEVTAFLAAIAAIFGFFNRRKLGQVETRMDGRLDELLRISKEQSFATGKAAGKVEEKAESAARVIVLVENQGSNPDA